MTEQHTQAPEAATGLNRTLGVAHIVFMVVAFAAPLTVFAGLIPLMLGSGNGIGTPVDFVIVGVVLVLFTVGYSAMTPEVRNAGAFYSYVQRGLGTAAGLGAAALALVTYSLLIVSVAAYLGAAARNVIHTFAGVAVPWWILAAAGLAAIGYLGYRNVEVSARVLGVLLIAEIGIVALVDVAIVLRGGADGLSAHPLTWDAFTSGATGTGIMFAVFGFVGFEATAVFRSEAKDPDRTIPRATYTAVVVIAAIYTVSSWAMINGIGVTRTVEAAANDPEGLAAGLATRYVSQLAHDAVQVLLVSSFFACVLTAHNVVSRYLFALGRQGALPVPLGAVHPVHRSPHVASLLTSGVIATLVAVTAILGLDPVVQIYAWFGGAGTLGLIVLLALTSAAIVVHFRRVRTASTWTGTVAPALALAALGTILVLVISNFELLIGSRTWANVFLAVITAAFSAGLAWAVMLRRRRPDVYRTLE
ncbi:amino acid permease, purative [Mycolicibacterium mageritense DSM 44476 = CIP 104973]|uniref:Amino acid transporter n=1 Tax=Mycolicibacterium mageritense TaxID=53462 RepID=A0ABM7HVI8_MYCME|nr:APC family permease [Mycolicibacterium mageritense]MCC9181574.1 APC family permease [Mycolicibacterium mageritense]OLP03234.1 amino acid transporter [Mycolicibacterium porcinum]BBX34610.1 amino acid transporter [Mycolicibacterium mageritense]CDO20871.1 amino acid permease [Mycolicibacterium mageritense DSM 44476 = CIP 104973]